jgi:hypothetical protein
MSNNIINYSPTNQDKQREQMIKREKFKALRERLKNKDLPDLENISDSQLRELVKLVLKKNVVINRPTRELFKRRIKNILREYDDFLVDSSLAAGKKRSKRRKNKNRSHRSGRGRGSKKMRK